MDHCPRCGTSFKPYDLFCGYCGFSIQNQRKDYLETAEALKLSDIQFQLGIVHFKKREYFKAIEKFEKTLENDAENKQAQKLLIHAKNALKQTRENL